MAGDKITNRRVDANRRDQDQILVHVNAVDLDDQRKSSLKRSDAIHSFSGERETGRFH
jgi:hypothetical protein